MKSIAGWRGLRAVFTFGRFTSRESPQGSRWIGQALLGREAENAW